MALQEFRTSWTNADSYPLNLALLGSNNGFLEARQQLLAAIAPELFNEDSAVVLLELSRDVSPAAAGPATTLKTDAQFQSAFALPQIGRQVAASKVGCRFIFIQAENSQARLDARLEHVRQVLTYFQVMPSFVDFISVFAVREGEQYEASDLRFSGFRDKINLSPSMSRLVVGFLGLGGYHYQLSYNLKCIANKSQEDGRLLKLPRDKWRWSPRQLVFHHQFDMELGTTLWILVAARDDLQNRVERLVGQTGRIEDRNFSSAENSFRASLVVHLLLAQAASEDWRGHLRWLEQVLEEKTQKTLRSAAYNPDISDLLYVQAKEDEASKAIMMLNANAEVMGSLKQFYKTLLVHPDFELGSRASVKRAVNDFLAQLDEFIHDFQMHSNRAGTLVKMTSDRKNLVQQRLQAKASDRVEKLTTEAQREAIIMRIIAVVTGIFLPATFVSTFFSTDVVKYQGTDGASESFSLLALQRWFEVTVVLTVVTFAFAWGWMFWKDMKTWLLPWRRKKPRCVEKAL